jgi:hypothetical protein
MAVTRLCSVARCGRYRERGTRCARHAVEHEKRDNARRYRKMLAHGRHTKHWADVRRQVLQRDGSCRRCGSTQDLTAHLDPRLRGRHDQAVVGDAIALCRSCHGVVDGARSNRSAA